MQERKKKEQNIQKENLKRKKTTERKINKYILVIKKSNDDKQ